MPEHRESSPLARLRGYLDGSRVKAGGIPAGVAQQRPGVAIICDSAAALPASWIASLPADGRLTVISMPIMADGNIFTEGGGDAEAALSLALAAGRPVRTSRPSPGQFEHAIAAAAKAGYEAAVILVMSAKLSGTFEAATLAASAGAIPVQVVDTAVAAMAQGFAVQTAYVSAVAGATVAEIIAAAQTAVEQSRLYFYVPSLETLRRGGRIGPASAWLGTVFSIKPILTLRAGLVAPVERVRLATRAIARLEELVAGEIAARQPETLRLAVHFFGNADQGAELTARLRNSAPAGVPISMSPLPAVLAAHTGLGVLSVVVNGTPLATDPPQAPSDQSNPT
ncbi:MAG: DegV family protein [Acidobacteria bacterium]|nr:DegV family protein [Acidobacteriota bacterium]